MNYSPALAARVRRRRRLRIAFTAVAVIGASIAFAPASSAAGTNIPVITGAGTTAAWTEGNNVASSSVQAGPSLLVSDGDGGGGDTITKAEVTIGASFQSGADELSAVVNAPLVATWDNATQKLTIAGGAIDADYQVALRAVRFNNNSDNPTTASRTLTWTVTDNTGASNPVTTTVSITAANDSPVLTTSGGNTAWTEGNNVASTAVAIDGGLTATDVDTTTFSSATVSIGTGFQSGEDALAFTSTANIVGTYNSSSGVMTLVGADTKANYQAALRSVTYNNSSDTPNTTSRVIRFSANDGNSNSADATKTVTIAAVNDWPTMTTSGGTTAWTEANNATSTAVAIDGALAVADVDSANIASAKVSITTGFQAAEDVLAFTNTAQITGSYNAATGVLTLSGSDTKANYQAALRTVTYNNSSDTPDATTRVITFTVNDGNHDSADQTKNVSIAATNDAPVVTTQSGTATWVEAGGGPSVAVDPSITATDGDNANFAGATVSITAGFQAGEDVLSVTNGGGVTGSYNATTGVLTLSGTATKAAYQSALRSVTYRNASSNPNATTRTVTFTVSDGAATGTATRSITLTVQNDPPVASGSSGTLTWTRPATGTATPVIVDNALVFTDVDNSTFTLATMSITSGFQAGDVLSFTANPATMGNITGTYDSKTGALLLMSNGATATPAQWQAALRSITFTSTLDTPSSTTRVISTKINDGVDNSNIVTRSIIIAIQARPVPPTPPPPPAPPAPPAPIVIPNPWPAVEAGSSNDYNQRIFIGNQLEQVAQQSVAMVQGHLASLKGELKSVKDPAAKQELRAKIFALQRAEIMYQRAVILYQRYQLKVRQALTKMMRPKAPRRSRRASVTTSTTPPVGQP